MVGHDDGGTVVRPAERVQNSSFVLCMALQHVVDGEADLGCCADGAVVLHVSRHHCSGQILERRIERQIRLKGRADDAHACYLCRCAMEHADIEAFTVERLKLAVFIGKQFGPD